MMPKASEGRVVLITGGGRRLGAVMAEALHEGGWRVIIHCRNSQREAGELVKRLNEKRADSAQMCVGSLTEEKQLLPLVREAQAFWGRVDGLVNNAAIFNPTPIATESTVVVDTEAVRQMLGVNAVAPMLLSHLLGAELKRRKGWILNLLDAVPRRNGYTAYDMSKAALLSLTYSLAADLEPVRVNALLPLHPLPPLEKDNGIWRRREDWPDELRRLADAAVALAESSTTGEMLRLD